MLSELRLGSFKAFASSQYAPLAPITLIYGPNSSGKSSIIQSLLLLKQSLLPSRSSANALDFNGQLVDLGDFANTVFRHLAPELHIGLSYSTKFIHGPANFVLPPSENTRSVDFSFAQLTEEIRTTNWKNRKRRYTGLSNCTYRFGDAAKSERHFFQFSLRNADREARQHGLRYKRERDQHFFRAADPAEIGQIANYLIANFSGDFAKVEAELASKNALKIGALVRTKTLSEILSSSLYSTSDFLPSTLHRARLDVHEVPPETSDHEVHLQFLAERYGLRTDFLSRFADEIRRLLDQVSYIGPFRRPPERIEILRDRDADTVGRAGEYLHYMLHLRDKRASKLNRWLKKLSVPYIVELVHANLEDKSSMVGSAVQIRYRDVRYNTSIAATDIGYGIGQVIPIIVEGALSTNKIIVVEQPELHLHPKLQADLADLFLETSYSERNRDGNQWIIETHSELILLRILRRLRERGLNDNAVKVLYVDPPAAGVGALGSQIFDLELDEHGRFLVPWPNGFFDEQGAELFNSSQS